MGTGLGVVVACVALMLGGTRACADTVLWEQDQGREVPDRFRVMLFPSDGCTVIGPDGSSRPLRRAILATLDEVSSDRVGVHLEDGQGSVARSDVALLIDGARARSRVDAYVEWLRSGADLRVGRSAAFRRRDSEDVTTCTLRLTRRDGRSEWFEYEVAGGEVVPV